MLQRKQHLLARSRKRTRLRVSVLLIAALVSGMAHWALPALLVLLAWLAHEAWGADHLFYSPYEDYCYRFRNASTASLKIGHGELNLETQLPAGATIILQVSVNSGWLGRFIDPHIIINGERFDFERCCSGTRFVNLSNHRDKLSTGTASVHTHYCKLEQKASLFVFNSPDFAQSRIMVIAPHADDAELAAFGLYSTSIAPLIVTITQGEAEAERLTALGLSPSAAARLKGRLRSWDSVSIPLWGGVPPSNCVQLGYFCLQLKEMQKTPDRGVPSPYSGDHDTRTARSWNLRQLPSDADGRPNWHNLINDLRSLLADYCPEVVVTPHPEFDPHPDHQAATAALLEALVGLKNPPGHLLYYANHLHDNDRWPMGPAGGGVTLPPCFEVRDESVFWSLPLPPEKQLDKAMALGMHHDLQGRLPLKKRIRRTIQKVLARREWPPTGDSEFFRKAVRSHELFWVGSLPYPLTSSHKHNP